MTIRLRDLFANYNDPGLQDFLTRYEEITLREVGRLYGDNKHKSFYKWRNMAGGLLTAAIKQDMRQQFLDWKSKTLSFNQFIELLLEAAYKVVKSGNRKLSDLPKKQEALQLRSEPSSSTTPPNTPAPLFVNNDTSTIATSAPMLSSIQPIMFPERLAYDEEGRPFFLKRFSEDREINHRIIDVNSQSCFLELLPAQAAWTVVQCFGIPTAHLHMIFAAYATETDEPWQQEFSIRGTDILTMLGRDKRRADLPKAQKLKELALEARALRSLSLKAIWHDGNNKFTVEDSPMWTVGIVYKGEGKVIEEGLNLDEVILSVRPGPWTKHFLNRAGAKAGTALRQFGYMAKSAMQIDPYHNEMAAALAIHLVFMGRQRETFKVRSLLEAVAHHKLALAQEDRLIKHRLKQEFDRALLVLHEGRHTLIFDDQTYLPALRPDWLCPEEIQLEVTELPRDYFDRWLEAKITIQQPDPIPQLLAAIKEKPATKPKKELPQRTVFTQLTGEQIKQARKAKGLTQREMAKLIGKSQDWVALVEQGKRKIKPEIQETLRRILSIEE